ncbi:hypothetical protein [Variovorax rhizosphaerae]|uniref:Organic solvent tolerance-like N-terminal domain-containing protein n=1 Tax=Variovorax rhizosphaerae TaxID=1836200 RepID=A0ABU8WEA7_9BURK
MINNFNTFRGRAAALAVFALAAAVAGQASAKEVDASLDVGVGIKTVGRVGIPGGKERMTFNAEGAGKLTVAGREMPVFVACDGTDIVVGQGKVVDGFADCEARTIKAGVLYFHFQKVFEADGSWNQIGNFVITGATGELADLKGTLAARVDMSPPQSGGKLVFGASSKGKLTDK